jgi:rSAM/selenodomain-associated transferase 1
LERLASLDPILSYTGASAAAFREWLPGVALLAQAEGDLGARMLAAMGEGPAVIVGSDVPDITAGAVQEAARLLGEADLVLGPAEDGGFWLIGVRAPDARLFADVDWGTGSVLAAVEANAKRLGWRTARAATLADLDRPEDLKRWPELAP